MKPCADLDLPLVGDSIPEGENFNYQSPSRPETYQESPWTNDGVGCWARNFLLEMVPLKSDKGGIFREG